LHWYGQQKLTAKSIKPTQKKAKYNNILPTYTVMIHMHTNGILTNKRCTHAQSNSTNTTLQASLGASYAIRPGNGAGLFYSPRLTWGCSIQVNSQYAYRNPKYCSISTETKHKTF